MRKLWKGRALEVVGITGEYNSGKTLFVLSIDPKNTRYYDFEKSGADFAIALGATRIDTPAVMLAKHRSGYSPQQMFEWWVSDVKQIQPGQYSVIAVDTIGDIETGLADYVANKLYTEHGFKTPEKFTSMGGVFWAAVKAYWKSLLADLASRAEVFVFTSHLKTKYKNKIETSEKTPAGKTTLMELCSLYLWLERKQTEKPSATVLKSRLTSAAIVDGALVAADVLPPRLPEATYHAICQYIDSPAGNRQLLAEEKPVERLMNDDDKLRMRAEIAENERVTAEIVRDAAEAKKEMRRPTKAKDEPVAATQSVPAESRPEAPETKPGPRKTKAAAAETKAAPAETKPEAPPQTTTKLITPTIAEGNEPPSREQLLRVAGLKKELNLDAEGYLAVLKEYEVMSAKELTASQCDMLIKDMTNLMQKSDLDAWADTALSAR